MGMGIAGAAWATTFSQFFGLSIFARILYLRREEFGLVEALDECQTRLLLRRQASSGDLDVDVDVDVDAVDADAVPACPPTATFVQKYVALVKDLDWATFLQNNRKLAFRAVLLLSTYTTASMVATNLGTLTIAAHQVTKKDNKDRDRGGREKKEKRERGLRKKERERIERGERVLRKKERERTASIN